MTTKSALQILVCLLGCLAPEVIANADDKPVLIAPAVVEAGLPKAPVGVREQQQVRVLLAIEVDAQGEVSEAALLHVQPDVAASQTFAAAAIDYVRSVRFSPALRDGAPTASTVQFEVIFPAETPAVEAPDPPDAHVHAHAHALVHSHAHASEEPHAASEFGAEARVARNERAASSYTLTSGELPRGAHVLPGDLAAAVPSLLVLQHAGGGKANQYFLRGFDADHGTDIALTVDGIPVNMVSHGHGQGYADLSWVIPELVESVEVRKGAYDARDGDFATAGAIDFQTRRVLPESRVTLELGSFDSYRALALLGSRWKDVNFTSAAELTGTDGPFERDEALKRVNLFARAAATIGSGELVLTVSGYLGGWNASGQIPLRAVRAGRLSRFGYVDPHEGGSSARHNLSVQYRSSPDQHARWEALGYLTAYRFALRSNFTLFRDDPIRGDMIHQRDTRTLAGFKTRYEHDFAIGSIQGSAHVGGELRHDRIENGLSRAPRAERAEALVDATVEQTSTSAYVEAEVAWLRWLRTIVGLRGDAFGFAVEDTPENRDDVGTSTSGERLTTRLSPKASLIVSPLPWLSAYGNYGFGFHSNDARGVVRGVTPLTEARSYEVGLSLRLLDRIRLRTALFRVDLDSELVWVGDEGTTEASGRTRREGLEAELRADISSWLWLDTSISFVRARFVDAPAGEAEIPLAPRRLLTSRLTAAHPTGPFARVAALTLGDRPATEDAFLTAEGFTRIDLSVGYRHPSFELSLALENLLGAAWRESQFATLSRLPGEGSSSACTHGSRAVSQGDLFVGCEDVHFTPGTPFAMRASASVFF